MAIFWTLFILKWFQLIDISGWWLVLWFVVGAGIRFAEWYVKEELK